MCGQARVGGIPEMREHGLANNALRLQRKSSSQFIGTHLQTTCELNPLPAFLQHWNPDARVGGSK